MVKTRKKRRMRRRLILVALLAAALILSVYDSNTRIETEYYELYYPQLPASFDGYRIVQLSDMHANTFGNDSERLIGAIKEAKPHIIAITGDLISADEELEVVLPQLRQLIKIAPVYYVTGNHEWATKKLFTLLSAMDEIGIDALRNEYVRLTIGSDSIVLAGVDDENGFADMKKPDDLMAEIRESEGDAFTLLLAHRPENFSMYSMLGFDTVLSGHIHGGLIRLPFLGGLLSPGGEILPEYTEGIYEENESKMVVSRGLNGVEGFPRIFNPLHIPVIILRMK